MVNITSFSRNNLQLLRENLADDMKMLSEKYGANFKLGNAKFNSQHVEFKLAVDLVSTDGIVYDKYADDFKMMCTQYGFKREDLGLQFKFRDRRGMLGLYNITGLNTRAHKMPLLAKSQHDGKTYKFSPRTILTALGRMGSV